MDDVARAEEALVEAMAQVLRDEMQNTRAITTRDVCTLALAAAREVTVSVPCGTCGGSGWTQRAYHIPTSIFTHHQDVRCSCSNGTVSRSALAVLMGEEE